MYQMFLPSACRKVTDGHPGVLAFRLTGTTRSHPLTNQVQYRFSPQRRHAKKQLQFWMMHTTKSTPPPIGSCGQRTTFCWRNFFLLGTPDKSSKIKFFPIILLNLLNVFTESYSLTTTRQGQKTNIQFFLHIFPDRMDRTTLTFINILLETQFFCHEVFDLCGALIKSSRSR